VPPFRVLESEPLRGKRVLDYGCGPADFGLWMATEGASVTLLDISAAAIELGLKRAAASGVTVRGIAADAASLDILRDAEFDLVFACASLHHTMKYPARWKSCHASLRAAQAAVQTWCCARRGVAIQS
jgi:ubiquinone/menaquinone biosynthesis C-methylase UbiE